MRVIASWLAISASTVLVMRGVQALADGSAATDSVPGMLAYDGTLAKDGAAYTGTVTLVFSLYDGVGASDPAWSETQAVEVERGRFSALLGSTSTVSADALRSLLANADDLYLGVAMQRDAGTVTFGGRQRLLSAANALWAPASNDAVFSQRVAVKSGVEVVTEDGSLALAPNSIEGLASLPSSVQVGGKLTAVRYGTTRDGNPSDILEHLSGDRLAFNQGPSYIDNGLQIDGALQLPGVVSGIETTVTNKSSCTSYDLGATTGALNQVCPDGSVWIGGTFQGLNNNGKLVQLMECCPLRVTVQ